MDNDPSRTASTLPEWQTTAAVRPELVIAPDYLRSAIATGQSNRDIALSLGISEVTVKCRLQQYGIPRSWSEVTEQDVLRLIRTAKESGLECVGSVGIQGYLEQQEHNVRVSRRVVRSCLKKVDGDGTRER